MKASQREAPWQVFVSAVPSCASLATSGNTLDCLAKASREEIFAAVNFTISHTGGFSLTLDGPDGLVPGVASTFLSTGRFARLPFIAGTNLDEGKSQEQSYMGPDVLFPLRNCVCELCGRSLLQRDTQFSHRQNVSPSSLCSGN